LSAQVSEAVHLDGVDALSLLTPLLEKRRAIILWSILVGLIAGGIAAVMPRKYKAELSLTPVLSDKTPGALGGIAALAGASLNTGYQLTPARMVELLKSRTVLSGVGMSTLPKSSERIIDRVLGERYTRNDEEEVAKQIQKLLTASANKETGTIAVSVFYKDSALARLIASRVVDSASQRFVRTAKAQAQQLRIAQEGRVNVAKQNLAAAEERLRQFRFSNRATPPFSAAAVELEQLNRDIQMNEQVYTQAITDQQSAFARELEATPTVVTQDRLPVNLPKLRKHIILKTILGALVSFVVLSLGVLLTDLTRRRLARADSESVRFQRAVSTLPRLGRRARTGS
jgi:uncharacterized protein involved in exopolysaccharide biosynthesis